MKLWAAWYEGDSWDGGDRTLAEFDEKSAFLYFTRESAMIACEAAWARSNSGIFSNRPMKGWAQFFNRWELRGGYPWLYVEPVEVAYP